ncbi:MAG: hypothetical protein H6620_08795 [Halobacteriovoraceae bacterium]|nr:hypothetical protein [Halobacteriovoraceae bacterium]
MYFQKIFKLILALILFTSCLKTAEELQHEKEQSSHLQESQKMLAELTVKTKELEEKVSHISGNFEEVKHEGKLDRFQQDDIDELRAQVEANQREILEINKELKDQKKFIKQLTQTLGKISKVLGK